MKDPRDHMTPGEELFKEIFSGKHVINLNDYATNKEAVKQPVPEDDLDGLNSPSCWPHRPILPVKKRGEGHIDGVVVEGEIGKVYLVNLWNLIGTGDKAIKITLGNAEMVEYDSWEEMLKDGWMVD